jgi:hypothetical protein
MILFACLLATAASFYYIFHIPDTMVVGAEKTRVAYLHERKEVVYENLRDLNFEYKAGKVPEADYRTMKDSLEEEAAAILAEIAQLESGGSSARQGLYKKGQRV